MSGWKTYAVSVGGIITEIGMLIGGKVTITEAAPIIFTALVAIFLRHGMTTEAAK